MHDPAALRSRVALPLIAAPMFLVSGPDLVVACCREGVIGSFPTPNARTPDILDQWMDEISRRLDQTAKAEPERCIAPWAANLVVHPSNTRLADDLALILNHRPSLVVTALGSPARIVDQIHAYGGLVFADVNSVAFARKAVAAGVDGLVLVAAGAGGHTGSMTGFAMVPAIREFFEGPLVLGGGICTGQGIRAAEVLGADFAYMGTSFIAATESLASDAYKRMLVAASVDDIILTKAITGVAANWLKPSIAAAGFDLEQMERNPEVDFTDPQSGAKRWAHTWSAGQGVGQIHAIEPAAGIIQRLSREYEQARQIP